MWKNKNRKMTAKDIVIIVAIILLWLIPYARQFPMYIPLYDGSRGITVTIYDLKDRGKPPIKLTSGEFFCNLGPESEHQDIMALPLRDKLSLKLWDYETQYRIVFHRKGFFIGYGYICRVDPKKVDERENYWQLDELLYDSNGNYYALRYDFRIFRMSRRQTENFTEILENWK